MEIVLGNKVLVVNDMDTFLDAQANLKDENLLYVDCEGVNLCRYGSLRLIQIGDNNKKVYLFDVESGTEEYLNECKKFLKEILESNKILKVMHGCNFDSDAIQHHLNIMLTNVVDTQVVWHHINYHNKSRIGFNHLMDELKISIDGQHQIPKIDFTQTPNIFQKSNKLSKVMVQYSSFDVIALRHIWSKLSSKKSVEEAVRISRTSVEVPRNMKGTRWLINNKYAIGKIIGRGGSNLRQVQQSTNTFILQSRGTQDLHIYGYNNQSIQKAKKLIERCSRLSALE